MMNPLDDGDTAEQLVYLGAAGGAISFGLFGLADFNIATELLSSSPDLIYGAFAAAGGIDLAHKFGLVELGE